MRRKREDDLDERFANQYQKKKLKVSDASEILQIKPTFSSLPVEAHGLIFQELDIEDVLGLSFTNQYFWGVGRKHIQTFFISFLGSWTGESIICVGQDIENGDCPPGMLTVAEEKELQQVLGEDEEGFSRAKLNLHDFASEKIKSDVWFPPLFGQMVGSKQYKQYRRMPESIRSQVCHTLNPELSLFYPEDQP